MKKKWLVLPILTVILIFTLLPVSFLNANPANLVQNGDFAGGSLNFWNSWGNVSVMNGAVAIYSNASADSGIYQLILLKKILFSDLMFPPDIAGVAAVSKLLLISIKMELHRARLLDISITCRLCSGLI